MKKIFYLLILCVLPLCLASCGDDDDDKGDKFVFGGDWNNPEHPNYHPEGYNPIQGVWEETTKGLMRDWYTSDYEVWSASATVGWKYTIQMDSGTRYEINNTAYRCYFGRWKTFEYRILRENGKTYLEQRYLYNAERGEFGNWIRYIRIGDVPE